jgi:hypothetical protein
MPTEFFQINLKIDTREQKTPMFLDTSAFDQYLLAHPDQTAGITVYPPSMLEIADIEAHQITLFGEEYYSRFECKWNQDFIQSLNNKRLDAELNNMVLHTNSNIYNYLIVAGHFDRVIYLRLLDVTRKYPMIKCYYKDSIEDAVQLIMELCLVPHHLPIYEAPVHIRTDAQKGWILALSTLMKGISLELADHCVLVLEAMYKQPMSVTILQNVSKDTWFKIFSQYYQTNQTKLTEKWWKRLHGGS